MVSLSCTPCVRAVTIQSLRSLQLKSAGTRYTQPKSTGVKQGITLLCINSSGTSTRLQVKAKKKSTVSSADSCMTTDDYKNWTDLDKS